MTLKRNLSFWKVTKSQKTPSTARREPPKLGKLTSGNPKARSPYLTTPVAQAIACASLGSSRLRSWDFARKNAY